MVSPAVAPQVESANAVASLEFAAEGHTFSSGTGGDELWFLCLCRAEKGATRTTKDCVISNKPPCASFPYKIVIQHISLRTELPDS